MSMEKLGVSKEQLLEELRSEYNAKKAQYLALDKQASSNQAIMVERDLKDLEEKINEVENG